jgi:hypothetical protein
MKFGTVASIKWWYLIVVIAVMIVLYFTLSIHLLRYVGLCFSLEAFRSIPALPRHFLCLHTRKFEINFHSSSDHRTRKNCSYWKVYKCLFFNLHMLTQHSPWHEQCSRIHLGSVNNFVWLLCRNSVETEDCYLLGRDDLHIYQTTRNRVSEDSNLHRHVLENPKSNCTVIIKRV